MLMQDVCLCLLLLPPLPPSQCGVRPHAALPVLQLVLPIPAAAAVGLHDLALHPAVVHSPRCRSGVQCVPVHVVVVRITAGEIPPAALPHAQLEGWNAVVLLLQVGDSCCQCQAYAVTVTASVKHASLSLSLPVAVMSPHTLWLWVVRRLTLCQWNLLLLLIWRLVADQRCCCALGEQVAHFVTLFGLWMFTSKAGVQWQKRD
jgi:hypothetical protein